MTTRDVAEAFMEPGVARAYVHRPPYPRAVIEHLASLVAAPRAVLDVGCGTGDVARALAAHVERVDAVDFSRAMLDVGRAMPGGDDPRIRWILGDAETAAIDGPYGLIVAGDSVHWFDCDVALPRFAGVLADDGVFAITGRGWDTPESWEQIGPVIIRHSTLKDYRELDLIADLDRRGLFRVAGRERFEGETWHPTVDEYIEARYSQASTTRERMGRDAAEEFAYELRAAIVELCDDRVFGFDGTRLSVPVTASVVWGRPY